MVFSKESFYKSNHMFSFTCGDRHPQASAKQPSDRLPLFPAPDFSREIKIRQILYLSNFPCYLARIYTQTWDLDSGLSSGKLAVVQFSVKAVLTEEFPVRTLFHNSSFIHDED